MTGSIPASFFGLTNLLVLGLDDNLLESEIDLFAKLNQMQKLYIEGECVHVIRRYYFSVVVFVLVLQRIDARLHFLR